jgi:NAD(P)H-hydrate epimerase
MEFLEICQEYSDRKNVTLVLKGGPTFIFHPGNRTFVNPFGDPGMATAGSGDVLTGLLAALLAQGVPSKEAALLGVYLHGRAGEYAASKKTSYCMIASDIIDYFSNSFKELL